MAIGQISQIIAYVADMLFVGRRLQDDEVFTSLVEKTNKMGLEINGKKTKFVIVSRQPYHENEFVKLGIMEYA